MILRQLKDNRWIGGTALEIVSLPSAKQKDTTVEESILRQTNAFSQFAGEFFNLANGSDTSMLEFLWATETAPEQPFTSKIRLFIIIRHIGNSSAATKAMLINLQTAVSTFLGSLRYELRALDSPDEAFLFLPERSNIFAVIKREKCVGNALSPFPYYFCDVIPSDSSDNFSALISTLSQTSNCAVSFQIFPTQITQKEAYMLREMTANLNRLATGAYINGQFVQDAAAKDPCKVYSYYGDRVQAPLFKYNVLIFGTQESCKMVSSKIVSLLRSGKGKIVHEDFGCFDLSREHINLRQNALLYPWNINNKLIYAYRNQKLLKLSPLISSLMRLPYLVSAEEAAAFIRFPLYEQGMLALLENTASGPMEQLDPVVTQDGNIQFGTLASGSAADLTIGCPPNTFTKHALIVGVPGSGKTTFAFHILRQFNQLGIPFLAIEPTKAEYRGMIDVIPDLQIFTPGNSTVVPFIVNPFIPPHGIRIEQYIPSLASAFKAAFAMPSPLDVIFLRAIRECYIKYGWKDYSRLGDPEVTNFGLYEFILLFKKIIAESSYSREVKGNIESGGVFRLLNLLEQNRSIYDNVNTIPIEDLLARPTVVELNAIENAEQKALVMALLLINICTYTKSNQIGDGKLKNIILIDEAHVLLGGGNRQTQEGAVPDAQGATVKAIQDMIAEIRSFGTGIIIADQSPAKVSREVVAQTEIKVAFRLVQSVDKEMIADTTNMDAATSQQLSRLKTGEAYVYYSKLDSAQLLITPDIRENAGIRLSVPNEEIHNRMTYWDNHVQELKPYRECRFCAVCARSCDFKVRADADFYAKQLAAVCTSRIKSNEDLLRYIVSINRMLCKTAATYPRENFERLVRCVTIIFARNIRLETSFGVPFAELQQALKQPLYREINEIRGKGKDE